MTFLSWQACSSVNHRGMDQQHEKIFNQIDSFWQASFVDRRREVKEMLIQGLIQTIQQHFRDEEKLLSDLHYRDYPQHRLLHTGLSRRLLEFDNKSSHSNYHNAPEMMEFLLKAVVDGHILGDDREYATLFKS